MTKTAKSSNPPKDDDLSWPADFALPDDSTAKPKKAAWVKGKDASGRDAVTDAVKETLTLARNALWPSETEKAKDALIDFFKQQGFSVTSMKIAGGFPGPVLCAQRGDVGIAFEVNKYGPEEPSVERLKLVFHKARIIFTLHQWQHRITGIYSIVNLKTAPV